MWSCQFWYPKIILIPLVQYYGNQNGWDYILVDIRLPSFKFWKYIIECNILRGVGTGEAGEAAASPEIRGWKCKKFSKLANLSGIFFSCFTWNFTVPTPLKILHLLFHRIWKNFIFVWKVLLCIYKRLLQQNLTMLQFKSMYYIYFYILRD